MLLLYAVWSVPALLVQLFAPTTVGGALLAEGAMGLLAVLVLIKLRTWREAGFGRPAGWRCLWVVLLPALLAAAAFRGVALSGTVDICALGLLALLAAFQEETWHRGILLQALTPVYGVQQAVAVGSLALGLFELTGVLVGQDPVVAVIRALGAGLGGYIYAAVRLRTGSLWPGLILHGLVGLAHYLGRGGLVDQRLLPGSAHPILQYALALLVVFGISVMLVRRGPTGAPGEKERDAREAAEAS